jgi:hypothetical protein
MPASPVFLNFAKFLHPGFATAPSRTILRPFLGVREQLSY